MGGQPTSTSPLAVGYKGLSPVVLAEANVTEAHEVVRVPYCDRDGREVYAKLVPKDTARHPWVEPRGISVIPFGLERLPHPEFDEWFALVLAEGESDALAVRGSVAVRDDRSVRVLGLPGAGMWRSEFGPAFRRFPVVYVVGDGDAPGRRMMDAVLADVPWARPVRMPDGEDARSIIQGPDGDEAFRRLLDDADHGADLARAFDQAPTVADFRQLLDSEPTASRGGIGEGVTPSLLDPALRKPPDLTDEQELMARYDAVGLLAYRWRGPSKTCPADLRREFGKFERRTAELKAMLAQRRWNP